jgi:hypothetical protein
MTLKHLILFLCLLTIFSCSSEKGTKTKSLPQNVDTDKGTSQLADDKSEIRSMSGTVVYQEIEGGFFGIVAEDGKKYNPINLDESFKKDGLRVKFDANVKKGMVGIHMWGQYVEILKIEKLEEE